MRTLRPPAALLIATATLLLATSLSPAAGQGPPASDPKQAAREQTGRTPSPATGEASAASSANGSTPRPAHRGIGIPPAEQKRVFERFERAAPAQHYGGLGLGLWIVREIIEAMGGSIEVDSRVDEGSTFTVSLPRSRLEAGDRSGEGCVVRPD